MTKKITKTTLAVSVDIEVAEKLRQVARREERSVSQMVQRALVHYLPTVQCENHIHNSKYNQTQVNSDCLTGQLAVPPDEEYRIDKPIETFRPHPKW